MDEEDKVPTCQAFRQWEFDRRSDLRQEITHILGINLIQHIFSINACVSAVGEMLTNGAVKQEVLIRELAKYWPPVLLEKMENPTADLKWLAQELGNSFEFKSLDPKAPDSVERLVKFSPCATELKEGGKVAHAIVVDGKNSAGNILVRDPNEATSYEMTNEEFVTYWNGRVVKRTGE